MQKLTAKQLGVAGNKTIHDRDPLGNDKGDVSNKTSPAKQEIDAAAVALYQFHSVKSMGIAREMARAVLKALKANDSHENNYR